MLFWKITLKQFRSSSSYTQPNTHNFCEGPQPQRPNIALCRPTVLRHCYVWESNKYDCFYYITTVSITRLYLFCGNIWGAFKWGKQRKYIKRGRYKILYEVTCNTLLWLIVKERGGVKLQSLVKKNLKPSTIIREWPKSNSPLFLEILMISHLVHFIRPPPPAFSIRHKTVIGLSVIINTNAIVFKFFEQDCFGKLYHKSPKGHIVYDEVNPPINVLFF